MATQAYSALAEILMPDLSIENGKLKNAIGKLLGPAAFFQFSLCIFQFAIFNVQIPLPP
jgi:hypothetical protein